MYEAIGGHEEQLARVLELTRSARESAQVGDWSLAVALESERRPLLQTLFAQPIAPEARVRLVAAIREILASDAGLIALAAAGRNETAEESRKIRRGRKAAQAYAAAGKPGARNLPRPGKTLPLAGAPMARND
jgi:Flagellar protein FliT